MPVLRNKYFSMDRMLSGLIGDVFAILRSTAGVLKKRSKPLSLSFLMKALSFPFGIVVVYAAQKALDRGVMAKDARFFLLVTGLGLAAFCFSKILTYFAARVLSGVKAGFSVDMNREFAARFLGLDYSKAIELSSAENAYLLDYDYRNIEDLIFREIPSLASFLKIPVLFVLVFLISRPLALIMVLALPVMAIRAAWNSRKYEKLRTLEFVRSSRYTRVLSDILLNLKLVKSMGKEGWALDRINRSFKVKAESARSTSLFFSTVRFFDDIFSKFMMAFFGILGGYMIMNGRLTLGDFTAVSMYAVMMISEAQNVNAVMEGLAAERPSLKRSAGFIREIRSLGGNPRSRTETSLRDAMGDIEYEGVTFGYNKDNMFLNDVSFSMPASNWTLIKGPSGSGKTTLLCLFLGLLKPVSGKISISGKSVDIMGKADFYKGISVVHQEAYIFNDSLINNILLSTEVKDKTIEKALYCAGTDDLARGLLLGYNTRIGEQGFSLSGGQKKRVAIARALARNPEILLLDEATSDLDPVSEETVLSRIRDEYPGITVIYVTHRPGAHKYADRVFTLSGGKVTSG